MLTSPKNFLTYNFIVGLSFTILLIGAGVAIGEISNALKDHLKNSFLLTLLFSGIIILLSFISKLRNIATSLFYLFICTLLIANYLMLIEFVFDLINPGRGWVEFDGKKQRIMDMSWIWSILFSLIFSFLTTRLYHRIKRNHLLEITAVLGFTLIVGLIYLIKNNLI